MKASSVQERPEDDVERGIKHKARGLNAYNVLVLAFLCSGSMTYGYSASFIESTLGQPQFQEYFGLNSRPDGISLESTMNGLFYAGGVIGPLCMPWFADRFGRKWVCAAAAIIQIISGAVMCGSVNVGMFIAFRFFSGFAAFSILAAIPLLLTEIVPAHQRGALVGLHGVCVLLGYCIQGWVGFGMYFWHGRYNTWRPTVGLVCVWPLLLLIGLPFVPESPRWLALRGRNDEAEKVLIKLHQHRDDPENEAASVEFYQIKKQIAIDKTLGDTWVDIFRKPSYRKRASLAVGTAVIIQFTGVLVIDTYGPTLYRDLGFSITKQLLYPAAWLTFSVGTNIVGMFLVDRFPRPQFMAVGVLGAEACLIVEAAMVAVFVPSDNEPALQAAVAMFFVFQVFYGAMLNGTQFSYIGELFPTHIRSKGVCLGVAMISLVNVVWLQAAPTAFANIGWKYYLVFICLGIVGGILMWFVFPDTSHRPLEEIAEIFGDKDEVAIYHRDVQYDARTHSVLAHGIMELARDDEIQPVVKPEKVRL